MALWKGVLILCFVGVLGAWTHGNSTPYKGPCDLVACAEAYSVTRAMTANYSGPLFQLYNGSTTLDVGQTAQHTVDMSTWSSFCSGVASNCVYGIIYGQINSNNLVPSKYNDSTQNCAQGGTYECAAPFQIEAATGLPIITTGSSPAQQYYVGTLGGSDTAAVGITAGENPLSIVYNGTAPSVASICCGGFGIGHAAGQTNTLGTTFYIRLQFGVTSSYPSMSCSTNSTYCAGIDEESIGNMGADFGSSPKNIILSITMDGVNTITGTENGVLMFNEAPAVTLNPGRYIHLGGGGDLSQPAPSITREALFTNSALTATQIANAYGNMTSFYSAITFP